jgi:type II secretory pathway component GspD/PulD (secretin)
MKKVFFLFAAYLFTLFCISCSTLQSESSESDAGIRRRISAAVDKATAELTGGFPANIKIAVLGGKATPASDEETVAAYLKSQGQSEDMVRMTIREFNNANYLSQMASQIRSLGPSSVPGNGYADYAAEDLEYNLVKSGFRLVDRQQIEKIRSEQSFQMSGNVDDNSAVNIGKMTGANAVVTISVHYSDGAGRLVLKALDVEKAEIIAMARQEF